MKREDFKSIDMLKQNLVNRKKDVNRQKIEWMKIKQMKFRKETPGVMEYKYI